MVDNVVPFKPKVVVATDEPPFIPINGQKIIEFPDEHRGQLRVPQPDGTMKAIGFPIAEQEWWTLLAIQMMSRGLGVSTEPVVRINTDPYIHEQGSWMERRRTMEMQISKETLLQIAESTPFILTSSFNGDMDEDLYMHLSGLATEHRIAEEEPIYTEAMIIHPTGLEGNTFKLIWVEL